LSQILDRGGQAQLKGGSPAAILEVRPELAGRHG